MSGGILCIGIMYVIGCNQRNIQFFRHADQHRIDLCLFLDSMILQFQEEIAFSENLFVFSGCLSCLIIESFHQVSRNLPSQAGT